MTSLYSTTEPWVYNNNAAPTEEYDGKWLMFYKEIDETQWERACMVAADLAINIKGSTKCPNPRANSSDFVIVFYADVKIGLDLRALMEYDGKMYYKTRAQTEAGTRATGARHNFTFVIFPKFDLIFDRADVSYITAVGFRFRNSAPSDLINTTAEISFEAEPTNAYDHNAIKIKIADRHVAYVSKEDTHLVRPNISRIVEVVVYEKSARCTIVNVE